MFTPDPLQQRVQAKPASSTPLRDYLANVSQGVSPEYVVLPRSLAESMPLPWQQQFRNLLAEFHHAYGQLPWPLYRVLPSRTEALVNLDDQQLEAEGYRIELDNNGEVVYRDSDGRRIDNPEETMVLVTCLDPIPKQQASNASPADQQGQPQNWR